jgi:hypothetical protein
MSLDFLREHRGRRLRPDPALFDFDEDDEAPLVGEEPVDLDVETPRAEWAPVDVLRATGAEGLLPIRFVDGCHRGQTVAWVQDGAGHPLPVMLAEVGGVCLRAEGDGRGRTLRRECALVERVVTMVVDPFPWHEVESFAVALRQLGLRLVPASPPRDEDDRPYLSFDFDLMRQRTRNRSVYEMELLEEVALAQDPHSPTLVDGLLQKRFHGLGRKDVPVVGLVKTHGQDYLHEQGWRVFFALLPGQRTPVFRVPHENLPVVSWYLRLGGGEPDADSPAWGVVRVELTEAFWRTRPAPSAYVDALSAWLFESRCRQAGYARAAVSVEPIVQAEQSLSSLLSPPEYLKSWFYRQTGI